SSTSTSRPWPLPQEGKKPCRITIPRTRPDPLREFPSNPEANMHRTLPVLLLALVPALASAQATDASRALAQDAVIVDTHIDAPGMLMDGWMDLGEEAEGREFDYPKARAGGLD